MRNGLGMTHQNGKGNGTHSIPSRKYEEDAGRDEKNWFSRRDAFLGLRRNCWGFGFQVLAKDRRKGGFGQLGSGEEDQSWLIRLYVCEQWIEARNKAIIPRERGANPTGKCIGSFGCPPMGQWLIGRSARKKGMRMARIDRGRMPQILW